jgi:dynactin complex subunit
VFITQKEIGMHLHSRVFPSSQLMHCRAGVELDQKAGKNNGAVSTLGRFTLGFFLIFCVQVKGKVYFECDAGHGIFVRLDDVEPI